MSHLLVLIPLANCLAIQLSPKTSQSTHASSQLHSPIPITICLMNSTQDQLASIKAKICCCCCCLPLTDNLTLHLLDLHLNSLSATSISADVSDIHWISLCCLLSTSCITLLTHSIHLGVPPVYTYNLLFYSAIPLKSLDTSL